MQIGAMAKDLELNQLLELVNKLDSEGKNDAALQLLNERIDVGNAEPVVYAYRGHSLYGARRYRDALADLDQAISMQPGARQTLFLRARCRENLNDPVGALEDYRLSESFGLKDAWLHVNMGIILEYMGDLVGARAEFEKAVHFDDAPDVARGLLDAVLRRISEGAA